MPGITCPNQAASAKVTNACVTESKRVVRGGLWSDSAQNVRTVYRSSEEQDKSGSHIGFRLALDF
ncbi:MAG: SUMF1/EgtB/PvdO family nonheme iron enzyme [Candidatus Thiothrix putei]|uniref:SUMF1/EgtB/PvdO family nonheme iron enzyme n=1 Tax=Candidatus Thiothrix putei TaxID=3080811 RepID=A0AA95KNK7_9GAMM|nr:MAG: SUMF1/EgtB/PvdO family nonheme iron enzyme [Candidatus Thiothrix putei]